MERQTPIVFSACEWNVNVYKKDLRTFSADRCVHKNSRTKGQIKANTELLLSWDSNLKSKLHLNDDILQHLWRNSRKFDCCIVNGWFLCVYVIVSTLSCCHTTFNIVWKKKTNSYFALSKERTLQMEFQFDRNVLWLHSMHLLFSFFSNLQVNWTKHQRSYSVLFVKWMLVVIFSFKTFFAHDLWTYSQSLPLVFFCCLTAMFT